MTDLHEILEHAGIRKAVVIDDVFDDVPRPDELDDGDWSTFFDDLEEENHACLASIFPEFEDTDQGDLQKSQAFIDILWQNRERALVGPVQALFYDYETTNEAEKAELEKVVGLLQEVGLACVRMGRDLSEEARDADLIVIDLFLGRQQSESDIERAIRRVRDLVEHRVENPPLVILTSKSARLNQNRNAFRDEAGLLSSTFRVVSKSDLGKEGTLETMLFRLARHYEDAKRVASFVHAWNRGLDQARENFIQVLRRLDLSDLAQIRALLLDIEGERLGEYLLHVADRVVQHEIEGDDGTIAAALQLNMIDLENYPAPHLMGTPDLQDIVHRTVFLHRNRLRLSDDGGKPMLQFGDVLRWKKDGEESYGDDVGVVVTPACDLVRGGAARVMLLSGKLEALQPIDWSYKDRPVRTAIVVLPEEGRKWIKWNLKDLQTFGWDELDKLLDKGHRLSRIGRLREVYALEIQEMLLADLGRIGRPANIPVPFAVLVSLFYVDADYNARKLNVSGTDTAACYVGRDKHSKPVHRLVLTEQTCDQIQRALRALEETSVGKSARASLAAVKEDRSFFINFERGEIEMPPEKGTKYVLTEDNKIGAAILRGEDIEDGEPVSKKTRKAAVIVNVSDIPKEGAD